MDTGWTDRNKEKLAYMIFNQLDGLFVLISFAPVSLFLHLSPPTPVWAYVYTCLYVY